MKRDWRGHEHIPGEGGVIVASNHLSYVDWAAMALFVYESGRYPAFLIKSSMFEVKGLGAFLRACGQFPVRRGEADAALVLKDAERGLDRGECLIFYPEGTATRDPEQWPMVAKTGAARLALSTGVPVIPVACWGAQVILPYGSKKPHLVPKHTVQMLAGPPVNLSGYAGQPLTRDVLRDATAAIMADIAGLLAQLRGGTPPGQPFDPVAARRDARRAPAEQPQAAAHPSGEPAGGQTAGEPAAAQPEAAAQPSREPVGGQPSGEPVGGQPSGEPAGGQTA
jgi:1-acyl-sn-glycerol-3-phosphate acyltransferase